MSKGIVKAVVLLLVFLGTLTVLSLFPETGNVDLTSEMEEATLPIVYLKSNDIAINKLYGYKGEMNPMTVRDAITPLSEDLTLPVVVHAFHGDVDTISYAVRTMDMERLLEEKQVNSYSQKNGIIETELQIQNLLEPGCEYMFILTLESQGEKIDYYTRIIYPVDSYVEESLEFVLDFHETTFDKENASKLAAYLEPNTEGDNTTLQKVTIHSSLNQVTWGSFSGTRLEEPIPSVKEISNNYNAIVLNYVMTSTGKKGELEYYNVEEYFRVRSGGANSRMYLLDYQRTMNEIFKGNGIEESEILLGIRDMDVHYMANESGTILCFVQEGELWTYNMGTNQLSFLYSFRGAEGMNDRENNPNHDIRIIKVDESGSADFVVFGYMNRGSHEGTVGVGVYHYDSVANTIEEELFVSGDKSYQALKEDWGKLFYISDEGVFYMIADHTLYRVDIETGKEEKLLFELQEDNYKVSKDGRYIAWRKQADSQLLNVMDLEGEVQHQITAENGENLIPVGFIRDDFAYGMTKDEDKIENMLPMYKIVIINKKQVVIKEYEKLYVTDAYVEDGTIMLERVAKNESGYTLAEPHAIKGLNVESEQSITLDTSYSEDKQTQVKFTAMQKFLAKKPQILTPKEIVREKEHIVELKSEESSTCYHVYVGGKIIFCSEKLAAAIQCADDSAGVVIGGKQEYFWSRGRKSSFSFAEKVVLNEAELTTLTSATGRCLAAFLQLEAGGLDIEGLLGKGETPLEILQEAMPKDKVLDLTGCNVTQVLYYVNCGAAVYAIGENKEPLLVVGYDEHNIILYDPETNVVFKKGQKDSEAYFESAGNIFISYIRQEN